jgi:phosphoserine phosphatase
MHNKDRRIQLNHSYLFAFDFDGTLTTSNYRSSWRVVHEYFGTWEKYGEPALQRFLKGEISYYQFCKSDAEPWINRTKEEYLRALRTIELRPGAHELLTFLKQRRCKLVIISMGLSEIVKNFADEYNFDYWISNDIIIRNNLITGDVDIKIDMNEKGTILEEIMNKYQIEAENSIAIGDASADISLFSSAGISIAIEPSNEQVAAAADYICSTTDLREIITLLNSWSK